MMCETSNSSCRSGSEVVLTSYSPRRTLRTSVIFAVPDRLELKQNEIIRFFYKVHKLYSEAKISS